MNTIINFGPILNPNIFTSLVEATMDSIWMMNLKTGLIEYANQATFQLFACQPDDLLGQQPLVFGPAESLVKFQKEIIYASIENEGGWEGKIEYLRKNGELFTANLRTFCLRDDQNALPMMLVGVQQEISEIRGLVPSNLSKMAGEMAHEFNNLATIICGYIDFLLKQGGFSYELERDLKTVQGAGKQAVAIAQRFLNLADGRKDKKVTTELSSLVDDALQLVSRELKSHNISFQSIHHHQPIFVPLDSSKMNQVLLNLIINAEQAMSEVTDKVLNLKTGQENSFAFLEVSDTGCGIPEESMKKIFQPFFTTKNKQHSHGRGGRGIGLSSIKKIVEEEGGRITVKSTVGQGTAFTVYLPLAQDGNSHNHHINHINKQKLVNPKGNNLRGNKILIVDDEDNIRQLVKKALELQGAKVEIAENGKTGLNMLRTQKYQVVVTDLHLPDMRGEDFLSRINSLPIKIKPVKLVMTGETQVELEARLKALDVMSVLFKPFELKELYLKVSAAVRISQRDSAGLEPRLKLCSC